MRYRGGGPLPPLSKRRGAALAVEELFTYPNSGVPPYNPSGFALKRSPTSLYTREADARRMCGAFSFIIKKRGVFGRRENPAFLQVFLERDFARVRKNRITERFYAGF